MHYFIHLVQNEQKHIIMSTVINKKKKRKEENTGEKSGHVTFASSNISINKSVINIL